MHQGVAIAFAGRGQQEARVLFERQFQHAAGAEGAHVERLDGVLQVVLGAGGRRHIDHAIHRAFDREGRGDVLGNEAEGGVAREVGEVAGRAGQIIIQRDYAMTFPQKTVAHVRPDKPGGAGNDYSQRPSIDFILTKPR